MATADFVHMLVCAGVRIVKLINVGAAASADSGTLLVRHEQVRPPAQAPAGCATRRDAGAAAACAQQV
jgi:hypothetical protein